MALGNVVCLTRIELRVDRVSVNPASARAANFPRTMVRGDSPSEELCWCDLAHSICPIFLGIMGIHADASPALFELPAPLPRKHFPSLET
jgi:hypothetical protein